MADALRWRAAEQGELKAYTVVVDGERDEVSFTFAELDRKARAVGSELQTLARPGDRALVLCPVSLDYIAGMFACFYSGLVAVPAYAPNVESEARTLIELVRTSRTNVGVTTEGMLPRLKKIPELGRLSWVVPERLGPNVADTWKDPLVDANSIAVLVFTSGSVSSPRGVMVSHRNLFHWADASLCVQEVNDQDRVVVVTAPQYTSSFLAGIVFPVYGCVPATHVAPESIAARPARWLETISRTRATISSAANFLFDVCVRSIAPEAALPLR